MHCFQIACVKFCAKFEVVLQKQLLSVVVNRSFHWKVGSRKRGNSRLANLPCEAGEKNNSEYFNSMCFVQPLKFTSIISDLKKHLTYRSVLFQRPSYPSAR